jgi:glyoxylase I family protein
MRLLAEEDMMKATEQSRTASGALSSASTSHGHEVNFHGVRYLVDDVARAVDFYTRELGFKLEHQQLPDFAAVSIGPLKILLSGQGASGSRSMPSGQRQESGGWNRVVLRVGDLESCIEELRQTGVRFRNDVEAGPGGKQIQLEDPDGNPIELFEPTQRAH